MDKSWLNVVPAVRLISEISGNTENSNVDWSTDVRSIFAADDILNNIHQCTKIASIMRRKTVWLVRLMIIREQYSP